MISMNYFNVEYVVVGGAVMAYIIFTWKRRKAIRANIKKTDAFKVPESKTGSCKISRPATLFYDDDIWDIVTED